MRSSAASGDLQPATPDAVLEVLELAEWQLYQLEAQIAGLRHQLTAAQARIRKQVAMVPILRPEHRWECPSCTHTDVTHEAQPHTRMHSCRGLKGLTAPMVPAGTRAEHRALDREDYVNGDLVQTDGEGRPVMSVITIRDDGQDCTVYAPTATARGSA